jgi:hypothetical protein
LGALKGIAQVHEASCVFIPVSDKKNKTAASKTIYYFLPNLPENPDRN